MTDTPTETTTVEQLAKLRAIAERALALPLFVSDCEGELQVWAESALTHVTRDESGQITGYCLPSSYRVEDQVMEMSLSSWDLGESATDDYLRERVNDLVDARAALHPLLAEVDRLTALVADLEKDSALLNALEVAGVDNWEGYDDAREGL